MRKALPQRIYMLLPLLLAWVGTSYAQPRFSAFVHEIDNLQTPDFGSYDSFIYLYPPNTKLKHYWYTSVLSPDSQAVIKEKFNMDGPVTHAATLEYLDFNHNGEIRSSTMKTWSNSTVSNIQKTTYNRLNDSIIRALTTQQDDPDAVSRPIVQVEILHNGYRKGNIYYKLINCDLFEADNANYSTYNSAGELILYEYGDLKSGGFQLKERREYRYAAGKMIYKKRVLKSFQTTTYIDSNTYDPNGLLLQHFDWYYYNSDLKSTGDMVEYTYSNGQPSATFYYTRTTVNGINFKITRDKYISKDSFEYQAGLLTKFRQYETDFTHDTFRLKAGKYNTWLNGLQASERIMGWTFKGWDTLDFYQMTYNACGKLSTKDRSLPYKYNLVLNASYSYSYDAKCRLKTSLYTYPKTKTDRYTWYYDDLEVHSPDMEYPFNVTLHPNPVKDQLQITTDKFTDGADLTIYDMRGRPRIRQQFHDLSDHHTISVEQLPPGIYVYRISNATNTRSGRFVKI